VSSTIVVTVEESDDGPELVADPPMRWPTCVLDGSRMAFDYSCIRDLVLW
jgi:hypothetical protein